MRPTVTLLRNRPDKAEMEIVERKGLGHPDTICDALAEELSRNLCRYYMEHFGLVLHHNVDKGLIFAGRSEPAFKGGRILEPMEIFLVGRATREFKGEKVPVDEIAVEGTKAWFRRNFHALDPDRDIRINVLIRPGSQELVELFLRQKREGRALSNDTSCGIGFAPMTSLEQTVLEVEQALNSSDFHMEHPECGQDVKVMGIRRGQELDLTVACAMIGRYLSSMDEYRGAVAKLEKMVQEKAAGGFQRCRVQVNSADDPEGGSIYLTVTGTSAEAGDDGEVGRGNRACGLITPCRPMNMEAVAGKNPVNHVGKIYNIIAWLAARRIVEEIEPVEHCCCLLVSRIGSPVGEPASAEVQVALPKGTDPEKYSDDITDILKDELKKADLLWKRLIDENIQVY